MSKPTPDVWRLRAAVTGWLRYERRCPLVCWERSPFGNEHYYRPDICGVTRQWYVIEVEIKLTVADFRANRNKRGLWWGEQFPQQFYYAVPPKIAQLVDIESADRDGVLTWGEDIICGPSIEVVRHAAKRNGKRLDKYSAMRAVMHQSATLHRMAVAFHRLSPPCPAAIKAVSAECPGDGPGCDSGKEGLL